ncbi:MAG: zinc ribbon domain-containing protein [Chloroflexota bacterium]|nr:MAG: zinc ribbon domain-containing protein [Chloroflexota bacterium]
MQDLFGSMRQRAGDLMSDVGSEVDRQRQIRQLEKQINALEQELHSGVTSIGQQVIELYHQGKLVEPSLAESCRRILEGESYLSELNRQKQALQQEPDKKERNCQSCGGELTDEGEFCPHCGNSAADQALGVSRCGLCGAELTPGAVFCGDCGQPLDNTSAAVEVGAPAVIQSSDPASYPEQPDETPQPIVPAGGPLCDHCQTPLEPGAQFCGNCGWLIEGVEESPVSNETEAAEETLEEPSGLAIAAAEVDGHEVVAAVEVPAETISETMPEDDFIAEEPVVVGKVAVAMEVDEAVEIATEESTEIEAVVPPPEELAEEESGVISEVPKAHGLSEKNYEASAESEDEEFPTLDDIDEETDAALIAGSELAPATDDHKPHVAEPVVASSAQSCSNCGGLLRPGATFCPSCGEQVLTLPEPDNQPARVHCGVVLDDGMSFCPQCGEEVPFHETTHQFCSVCGATARGDARFCPDCGQPMDALEA